VQHDEAGEFFPDTQADGSGAGVPFTLPATRVRPLTRRRHARVPEATAAVMEHLAWTGADESDDGVTAVSVVPGGNLTPRVPRPAPAGADLRALLGDEALGCRPGRHREDRVAWHLLRRVPGWRPSMPAWHADAAGTSTDSEAGSGAEAGENAAENGGENGTRVAPAVPAPAAFDPTAPAELPELTAPAELADLTGLAGETPGVRGVPGVDIVPGVDLVPARDAESLPVDLPFDPPPARESATPPFPQQPAAPAHEASPDAQSAARAALDAEIAAAADLPVQREAATGPWYRQRRRRSPAPLLRAEIQAAGVLLQHAEGQPEIARIAAEQAARLVDADVSALVLRAVEGPRVLWLHPGGPDAADLWGPATLNALLGVGQPVRRVVEGDPLADGAATALLAVPVPSGGAIAGTLLARRHQPRAFSAVEQDVLTRLARMAGAALLSTARRTAFARGELDDVTGRPGGRRLSGDVAAAVRTADRAGMPVTVLAAHVLGLARLRTELGSPAADQVLGELARAFVWVLRVGDVAYRIGEDEFALLLPATDGAGVPVIRERLEAITAEVVAELRLPGSPRQIALRTAGVPLETVRAGGDAVDAVTRALELDRQKVRWTKGPGPLTS
jgi:GGDEF domain-containing protein